VIHPPLFSTFKLEISGEEISILDRDSRRKSSGGALGTRARLERLIKHARYYWPLLTESHLTRRLFARMLRTTLRGARQTSVPR
jgi:hypothetical protein